MMSENKKYYEEEMLLRTCNCDFKGTWRPSAILELMQEVSGMHSYYLGCGRDVLIQKNIIWVLSRLEVQMEAYPTIGDTIKIITFPMPLRRWFFPRYFIFKDGQGRMLGKASSLWVLLDINTRKMAAPDIIQGMLPDNSDLTAPMGMPATVEEVEEAGGKKHIIEHMPVYTDLDINGHVNNTKYVDWLCDALGIDTLSENCLQSICVNYDAEILPHEQIRIETSLNGNRYSLRGMNGEKRHFEIGGTLMKR